MILQAFFIGTLATIIGALPPGASNLAVIKTTLQENHRKALKVGYGAGVGEVLLALIAFSFGMVVQDFFEMNLWIQYLVAGGLAVLGIYFLVSKKTAKQTERKKPSKYLLGFTLGVLNPPVLIYWVLIFSLLGKTIFGAQGCSSLWLILFVSGVFLGKVATLYGYSKFGLHIQKKKKSNPRSVNTYIGITLIVLSTIQLTKLVLS